MEGSSTGGWFLSGTRGRLSDMEMPMHKRQQGQMGQPVMTHQTHNFPSLNMVSAPENDQSIGFGEAKELTLGGMSMDLGNKRKVISLGPLCSYNSTSDDEEPSFTEDVNGENCNGINDKRKFRWQRMKWTDNVIRLLIAVVASVGDDVMHEGGDGPKRKIGTLQKKGKWKMVSNIMISKGWCVSPQQCEDKFNDLNKRYKKLNDILGRGTSCQVVENPSLMDSMPHLTNKAKDEVRKILSSKHLFYREMCAYHNGQLIPGCHEIDIQSHVSTLAVHSNGNNLSVEREADRIDESDSDDNDSYGEYADANHGRRTSYCGKGSLKEGNFTFWPLPEMHGGDHMGQASRFPDMAKSVSEERAFIQQQLRISEEEKVRLQAEALDLEKQRFKWLRFRNKKDRELERLRLENEKMKLENDHMILLFKEKALHLGTLPEKSSFSCHGVQGRNERNLDYQPKEI